MRLPDLLYKLASHGVTVNLQGDRVLIKRPATLPPEAEVLLSELRERKPELLATFQPTRPACLEAGYCLGFVARPECDLYPLVFNDFYGLCRVRHSRYR